MTSLEYISILGLTSVLSIYLTVLCFLKKQAPGARSLSMLMLSVSIWTSAQTLQGLIPNDHFKYFFHYCMYLGISFTPPSVLIFVLDRHMLPYLATTKRRLLLYCFPLLTMFILISNPYHHLFYESISIIEVPPLAFTHGEYSSWFWLHTSYSYLLIASATTIIVHQIMVQSKRYRKQSYLLLAAIAVPMLMNVFFISIENNRYSLDLTPVALFVTGFLFFISISIFDFFGFSPVTKRLVYDHIDDLILVLDMQNKIIDCNTAFKELINEPFSKIAGRHIASFYDQAGLSTSEVEKIIHGTDRFRIAKNGEIHTYRIQESMIEKKNTALAKLYLMQNITDIENYLQRLEDANARLRLSQEAKSRYLSDLSHEIRTPIHGIIGTSHHLLESHEHSRDQSVLLGIHKAAHNILMTVNTILDYSKLEAGKLPLLDESFSIEALVTLFRLELQDLELSVEVQTHVGLDPSNGIKGNLKFMTESMLLYFKDLKALLPLSKSEFLIQLHNEESLLFKTTTSLDGCNSEHIEDTFRGAENLLTQRDAANPIGFALCQKLIDAMDGSFEFIHTGVTLIFQVQVPVSQITVEAQEPRISIEELTQMEMLIVVIDDSSINRMVIANQLKGTAFTIQSFSSGKEALNEILKGTFDLVLTD